MSEAKPTRVQFPGSSNLAMVDFYPMDKATESVSRLVAMFRGDGAVYEYDAVPEQLFDRFRDRVADGASPGATFREMFVLGGFVSRRVDQPATAPRVRETRDAASRREVPTGSTEPPPRRQRRLPAEAPRTQRSQKERRTARRPTDT